ncbi:MAG: phosphatase [Actinobacteria bacterium]|nr:phosphatase [Actinomycetota bacterium]
MTASPASLATARWGPQALRDYLVANAIAGTVATPRQDSLAKYQRMASGDPQCMFGLTFGRAWTALDVLAEMSRRCGVSSDPDVRQGPDFIDPWLTVQRLQAMAERLREVAAAGGTVLMGSGHPAGLLAIHAPLARHLRAAGCRVITPATGWHGQLTPGSENEWGEIRYFERVAVISRGAGLAHTHGPGPMQAMLTALADAGEPMPDLVLADHGFAGAAGAAGLQVAGFADCNDPALFIGEAEGRIVVSVPLDDNVQPGLYEPVTAFVLAQAGL